MAKKRKAVMAARTQRKKRGRTGKVGVEIFEQIESMVTDQKMKRTEAFQRLADKSGRNPGTVAANYYRIARQRGTQLRPRRTGLIQVAGGRAAALRGVERTLTRALAAVRELGTLIRQQGAEPRRLRQQRSRFEEIRRLVGRS